MTGRLGTFRRFLGRTVLAGVIIASPLPFFAQDNNSPAAASAQVSSNQGETKAWWQTITANGFISLSYGYNLNQPYDHLNQFRVFDFNDNEPQLDVAQLVIQRAIDKPKQFGFRIDVMAGSGVPEVTAAWGMFRSMQTGVAHHFDISELYASYIAPLGKGLRLDAGKMPAHLGSEVTGGYDGYNDEFSRSFIFGYGVPFTYLGAKVTYPFTSKLTGMAVVIEGWDEFRRYNDGYSWGTQLTLTPTKTTTLYFNFIHGPERQHNGRDQRSVGEVVGNWKSTPRLDLGFDAVYGHDQNAVAPGHDAIWKGLSGYVRYGFTQRFSLAFRGEVFRDGGGTRTGTDQQLQGYTITPAYEMPARPSELGAWLKKLDGKFAVRGELRFDRSDRKVFLTQDPLYPVKIQNTAAINLLYMF